MRKPTRYEQVLSHVFAQHYIPDADFIPFNRTDFEEAAKTLNIILPKNLGDIIYSYRYRADLPEAIAATAKPGHEWHIIGNGKSRYAFKQEPARPIDNDENLPLITIHDASPPLVKKYAGTNEQSILSKVRYTSLITTFTGLTSWHLQGHLRATVPGLGQIETDEVYIANDINGNEYIVLVEAKGGKDNLAYPQLIQDLGLAKHRYPNLTPIIVGLYTADNGDIYLHEFREDESGILIRTKQARYRLT